MPIKSKTLRAQGVLDDTGRIFPLNTRPLRSVNSAMYAPISSALTGATYPGKASRNISVLTAPKHKQFIRIPVSFCSSAKTSVKFVIAALDAA
jgi:hypothetical protein